MIRRLLKYFIGYFGGRVRAHAHSLLLKLDHPWLK